MKSGRRPKPVELKLLLGNPGRRPLPRHDAKPPAGVKVPGFLKGEAREEFRRVAPLLERLGLLTQLDVASLACYAQAVADFKWAVAILSKEGRVAMTSKGTPSIHPAVRIQRSAADAILKFSAEFGMSASSRAGLDITGGAMSAKERKFFGGVDDEDDEFFGTRPDDSFERFQRNERRRERARAKKAVKPQPEESGEPLG